MSDNPAPHFATVPRTLSIGLALTASTLNGPGLEVAAPGYVRRVMQFAAASDFPTEQANVATVEWPRAMSLWGNIGWLSAWTLDGVYCGWGNLLQQIGLTTPAVVRIDKGDVARFRAGAMFLNEASLPKRPYGKGPFGAGLYSRNSNVLIAGFMEDTFEPAGSACPGAANWTVEALP